MSIVCAFKLNGGDLDRFAGVHLRQNGYHKLLANNKVFRHFNIVCYVYYRLAEAYVIACAYKYAALAYLLYPAFENDILFAAAE